MSAQKRTEMVGTCNLGFVDIDEEPVNNNLHSQADNELKQANRLRAVSFNKASEQIEILTDQVLKAREKDTVTFADLFLASTLIKDAIYGRNIPHNSDPDSIRSYNLYNGILNQCVLYCAITIILALALFEKPAVPGLDLHYWVTIPIECVCLAVFIGRFLHNMHFIPREVFWKDKKNVVIAVTIGLIWLDIISYVIIVNIDEKFAIRWSRILRPLFIVNFSDGRQIRRAFRNIRRTLADILNVLILFAFCSVVFALLAFKLFHRRALKYPHGKPYFDNYLDCLWDLYVLVTTANNPDVMMPAYDNSNWFAIFFILYVLFTNYIFMSILLAVIYNNYRKHLKNEVQSYVFAKRQLLGKAFDVLKVKRHDRYVVTKDDWHMLMRVLAPNRSSVQVDLLLFVLDQNGDGLIERSEFLQVADLLNVQLLEVRQRLTFLEKYLPGCYLSELSESVKAVVKQKFFRYFFDICIIINAICIALTLDDSEWFFLVLFTLEIVLKLYAYGYKRFCRSYWNLFDTVIILSAVIATSVESIEHQYLVEENTLDILLVLRVLRLIKLIGSVKRFKIIITTIMNIGPSIVTYGGVIFIFYYTYAIAGMELFGNLIHFYGYTNSSTPFCGNAKLNNSAFLHQRYCSNNFNHVLKAFVVLFELMYVNQWNVLTEGFVLVTSGWAKLYFLSFHMTCVLLVLNIFVAFILEAFILEYNLSAGKYENAIETKIKELGLNAPKKKWKNPWLEKEEKCDINKYNELDNQADNEVQKMAEKADDIPEFMKQTDLRFLLKKKKRKTVLVLLQSMFESELNPEDLGPENYEEMIENDDEVDDENTVGNSRFYVL